jgi:uncharacterized membrane protein
MTTIVVSNWDSFGPYLGAVGGAYAFLVAVGKFLELYPGRKLAYVGRWLESLAALSASILLGQTVWFYATQKDAAPALDWFFVRNTAGGMILIVAVSYWLGSRQWKVASASGSL